MGSSRARALLFAAGALFASGCRGDAGLALFELLPPEATGINFVNEVPARPDFNIINYLNYYNGGGVAVGDVDGDGRPDLYFTSNLGENRLYLNRGHFQFEDVTERAGVAGSAGWTTGATMADVNGDGHLDIYVSAVNHLTRQGPNVLYINNGDAIFTDMTEEYGLGHVGYSTQVAFFDYDLDGDLDAYLLNSSTHEERGNVFTPQRDVYHPRAGDRLFQNDGERFVDVTAEAGIYGTVEGYGLGVAVSDLDFDGCPDIYVNNDFQENDFLYYNNCDGTFAESIASSIRHTSLSSMGVDAADFNNDGRPDVMVLDMFPEREDVLKTSASSENFVIEERKLAAGYHPQYARNTLQLNLGERRFSEIGYLAGVHATDWSWAPLFADLDNDGDKDLFVTNGIYHRPNDLDFYAYVRLPAVQASLAQGIREDNLALLLETMPQVPIPNHAYRNNGDLTFTNLADDWGLGQPGFSNGAAYVDLNDDGALDLVVNNVNAPAWIYRNRARERAEHHFLTVELQGAGANTVGIGAKVMIRHGEKRQLLEQMPTRGFQSSVDHRLHFGLGPDPAVDSVIVVWPDRRYQTLTDVSADQRITLSQEDAAGRYAYREAASFSPDEASASEPGAGDSVRSATDGPLFVDVTAEVGIEFTHQENTFYDWNREDLVPHLLSIDGPALATGDVNGDGLDDLFVGGAEHQAGRMLVQRLDGSFQTINAEVFQADSLHEDVDAVFFDADGDGDQDLYVVSAGNEYWGEHEALRDRLYVGDGEGGFRRTTGRLPDLYSQGSCVIPGDFDEDGDLDLFVGSRVVSREYGRTPRSYLLENDGSGRFRDVTLEKAEGLAEAGMVTSATWLDLENDGKLDLVVVGEWMPVRVFRQEDGRFSERTDEVGLSRTNGWWNHVTATDLTGDGRPDLVLGNLGLNSYIRASPEEPVQLHMHDFDLNGTREQFLTFYKNGVSYPLAGRDEVLMVLPHLRERFVSYADYGASRLEDIFPESELRQAEILEATSFASSLALGNADGTFRIEPLPVEAQFAPINAVLADDFDGDGSMDLLTAGNFYGVKPIRGRYDASYGLLLRGEGEGQFRPVDIAVSGLVLEGQARGMRILSRADGGRLIVVARNNDRLQILLHRPRGE